MMVQHFRFSLPVAAFAVTIFLQSVISSPVALAQDRRLSVGASTPIVASEIVNGSISGTVFRDANGDRKQDFGETGISYVMMLCHTLKSDGSIANTTTATTNIDGNYTISGLGAGRYRLECDGKALHQSATSNASFEISRVAQNVIGTFGATDEITPAPKAGTRIPGGTKVRVRDPLMN